MERQDSESLCCSKFEDHERTITGLTPFKSPLQTLHAPRTSFLPQSTFLPDLVLQPTHTPPEYTLHPRILKHTAVTEKMRARLRVFLMGECAKQWLFRETCAVAVTLADLYLRGEGRVEVEQLQIMMIACLLIAAKSREGAFPAISERTFGREELLEWERRVLVGVGFRVNPPTHYSHAQRAVLLWDHHTHQHQIYNFKFASQPAGPNLKLRRFYEQLDCVFMALASLEWEAEAVVVNLFYLHVRMLNVYEIEAPWELSRSEFLRYFYPANDGFLAFFSGFMLRYFGGLIDCELGCYLRQFLRVRSGRKEWPLQDRKQHYERIREWDEVQTLPEHCYPAVKAILAEIKHRKY